MAAGMLAFFIALFASLMLTVPVRAASFEEWWTRTAALAGPLAQRLAWLPEPAAQALVARAREGIAPYETSTGLVIPGLALVASAVRPAR
jgi:hypothetical protein